MPGNARMIQEDNEVCNYITTSFSDMQLLYNKIYNNDHCRPLISLLVYPNSINSTLIHVYEQRRKRDDFSSN